MLKIYGLYRSRATRNIWLCDELGVPFTLVPVIQSDRAASPAAAGIPLHSKSPEFLKINPNGHIPSIDDDGLILHESLGINLYLAKKHGGPLGPANIAEDGLLTTWTAWALTEIEPRSIQVLYNRVAKPVDQRDPKAADAAEEALRAPFAVLDKALAANGYVVGGRFTVVDINIAECVRYAMAAPALFDANPNVKAWLAKVQGRPAFKAMMAKRELEPA